MWEIHPTHTNQEEKNLSLCLAIIHPVTWWHLRHSMWAATSLSASHPCCCPLTTQWWGHLHGGIESCFSVAHIKKLMTVENISWFQTSVGYRFIMMLANMHIAAIACIHSTSPSTFCWRACCRDHARLAGGLVPSFVLDFFQLFKPPCKVDSALPLLITRGYCKIHGMSRWVAACSTQGLV